MSSKILVTPFVLLALVVSGCANTVLKPVAEADKDQSGQYDGEWLVKVQAAARTQPVEQWIFTCNDMQRELPLRVRDGVASMRDWSDNVIDTFINDAGEFRLEIPLGNATREKIGSSSSITGGDNTLIIQGQLAAEKAKGYYTIGVQQFGNNGCTAPVEFAKLEG